jgi:alpha-beta hydrolase superfamily lysophospholipase
MPGSTDTISLRLPDGGTIRGNYLPGAADFVILWVHGFGSHRGGEKSAAVREECLSRGWAFANFDFRGHGESSGTMHELRASRLLVDLQAIWTWLSAEKGHSRLGLIGSSMGGFASAWFAVQHPAPVVGCVLLAPAFGFLERRWSRLGEAERDEWRRTGRLCVKNEWVETELGYGLVEERADYEPDALARAWNKPALIFHGLTDDIVPPNESLSFVSTTAYPGIELRLLKDGDHRLTVYKDEIAREAGRFFARLISV